MGRVKQYSRTQHKKQKKSKKRALGKDQDMHDVASDEETKTPEQLASAAALSVGKKKQIFKKEKSKGIKARIQELKQQSRKLKKKKLDEKAEKKKIAKEIHRLKASLKANREIKGDDSEDDTKMD